jgi:tRNA nucleotidyltransferase (CCA-adding enzyme)
LVPVRALHPPQPVIEIARTLTDAGYETWCVGGAVRDALIGIPNQDWDLATAAHPQETRRLFRRTVPLGIEFGTVGVLDRDGKMHEVTTFRRDVTHDGRHAVVEFGVSLVEDLQRRDFTINAIAYDPFGKLVFDPFDGRADLALKIVRAVGTPIERFVEDRLRVLRGIRFASRFGFSIEPETWNAIVASAPFLSRLSAERVKQELDKTLEQALRPSEAFTLWQRAGAFESLVPVLATVAPAVLRAVDAVAAPRAGMTTARWHLRRQLRLATLFSAASAADAVRALKALRAPNVESAFVGAIVERWHAVGPAMHEAVDAEVMPSRPTLRGWATAIGRTRIRAFMRVAWARWSGERAQHDGPSFSQLPLQDVSLEDAPFRGSNVACSIYRELLTIALRDPIELSDLAVDGDDLRAAGIPNGPHYGTLLRDMLARVVADPTHNTRTGLLDFAAEWFQRYSDRRST